MPELISPKQTIHLFIGGPWDGRRVPTEGRTIYQLTNGDVYAIRFVRTPRKVFEFFALHEMDEEESLQMLFDGYLNDLRK